MASPGISSNVQAGSVFPDTRWSLIVHLGKNDGNAVDSSQAHRALEELCQMYWYPVYAFIRRFGKDPSTAEDLTQGFFHMVLRSNMFPKAQREKGRLRSFLLRAVQRYMGQEHERSNAQKRGGRHEVLSLDFADAEQRFVDESEEGLPPDEAFEKRWAMTLLDQALHQLATEHEEMGRKKQWAAYNPFLAWHSGAGSQDAAAASLGITVGAFRAALLRLRRRYRTVLTDIIRETLQDPDDLDEEIRYLYGLLSK